MPCKLDSTEDARSFRTKPKTAWRRDKLRILIVGRRRLLQRYWCKVPVLHIVKYYLMCALWTVFLLVQIEAKNGFETQKVKNWYRQARYLPHTPISSLYKIYIWGGVSTPWRQSMRIIFVFTDTYPQSANCVNCDDTNKLYLNQVQPFPDTVAQNLEIISRNYVNVSEFCP